MAKRGLAIKPRGYPVRRGMGAQSDFIVKIVLNKEYKAQQMALVQELFSAGVSAEAFAGMFHVRFDLLSRDPEGESIRALNAINGEAESH